MATPIDREQVLYQLERLMLAAMLDDECEEETIKRCIAAVKLVPTLTPPNEWVSVEDGLPEDNTQVLMWSARWKIAEAGSYYNQHFWVYSEIGDGYIAKDITYWMPLSAPPDRRPPEGEEDA